MSIYSIPNWSTVGTPYIKNTIVRYPDNSNYYYYSLSDHSDAAVPSASSFWGGVSSFRGVTKPIFLWKSSYALNVEHNPKTHQVQMGDGYVQRIILNINNDLLNLNLTFDLRTEKESTAITHFLFARAAQESFLFTPSPPYDLQKVFICKKWNNEFVFYQNYRIQAIFEEMPD